jgi:hypothetical protein
LEEILQILLLVAKVEEIKYEGIFGNIKNKKTQPLTVGFNYL